MLVNIYIFINIYNISIMTTQNYATVPYLLLFYQERIHDSQSPVLLNMKWIAHVMSKQDQ